ncbi:MAG: hypothetical protein HYU58_16775 [Proteobacteria bacterium]|nr:hypothetical protein [Pseudomonadota bacterium]
MFTQAAALRVSPRTSLSARPERPKPADPRAELQLFFKAYDAANLDFDADAVVALYDLPCLISGMHGNGSFTARGELRAHFARVFTAFRQQGLVGASLASLIITALSDEFARAEAVWSFTDPRGRDAANLASAYTLRRAALPDGGRWRIVHALALDDAERIGTAKRPLLVLSGR